MFLVVSNLSMCVSTLACTHACVHVTVVIYVTCMCVCVHVCIVCVGEVLDIGPICCIYS